MKLTMLVSMAGVDFAVMPGDVREFPDKEASRLIEAGYAQPVRSTKDHETAVKHPRKEKAIR